MSDDMMPGVFTLGEALVGALLHLLRSRFLYWRPAEIAPVVFLANANMAAIALEMITFLKAVFQVNRKS